MSPTEPSPTEPSPTEPSPTEPHRERTVDVLRALGIVGVVTGHWLVTAVVVDTVGWGVASPLRSLPALTPVTWVLQTLAPLFFAAGYAATASLGRADRYLPWLRRRVDRLTRAVAYLVAFWLPLLLVLALTGTPFAVVRQIGWHVVSPLWFLGVLAALLALTPLLVRSQRRGAIAAAVAPLAVVPLGIVAADDLARFGPWSAPAGMVVALGWAAVLCAWMVPYQFGVALARGGLAGRGVAGGLVAVGAGAAVLLVVYADYPASMVGGAGGRSNLDPPSMLQMAFTAVQIGLFLLARPWLARIAARPRVWSPVSAINRLAMPVYLWHQSALVLVILASATVAPMPGLVDAPSDPLWLVHRVCWLPVVVAVLAGLFVTVGRTRQPARSTSHPRE
ncbi:MAG TPA: acyltransferase [Planosporangium sp.]|jgi:hypothetical protein|nr:acyltransferase [Planosporangium sp.]